jgi:phosphate/sulfate permease
MDLFALIAALLFLLALLDLVVGVSNDAVNFLNSAIGSRVATRRTIMTVASAGILTGAMMSSGMMEVARNGVFHPGMFTFQDIMILFLAVMLADVLLLDVFNTLALPTSTTVSIVFELLGAAVGLAVLIALADSLSLNDIGGFINGRQAAVIVGGIFLSVAIAFTVGALVQYVSRLLFTFELRRAANRYLVPAWSALALTSLSYFLLVKGLGGATFLPAAVTGLADAFGIVTAAGLFVACLVVVLTIRFAGADPLRFVVLFGTFALAMAFAGNDLVNFIGVPLAGLTSWQAWSTSGLAADQMTMDVLAEPVRGDTIWLLLAGAIMAATLWLSSKARAVTETEVNLGRQDDGAERFRPGPLSRAIVRGWLAVATSVARQIPAAWAQRFARRFAQPPVGVAAADLPAFDLLRASVNLTVASVLIAIATSFKLPLSTTYVSFMVAMGTSLADGAWGRDSAVYRVAGVLSVIGGWFVTALVAFTTAALFAILMRTGGSVAIAALVAFAAWALYRSHLAHRKRSPDDPDPGSGPEDRARLASAIAAEIRLASAATCEAVNALLAQDRAGVEAMHEQTSPAAFAPRLRNTELGVRRFLRRHGSAPAIDALSELRRLRRSAERVTSASRTFVLNLHVAPPAAYQLALAEWAEQAPSAAAAVAEHMVETSRRDVTSRVESLAAINSRLLNALVEDNAGERSIRNTTLLLGIALELDEVSNSLARLMRVAGPGAGDSFEPRSVSNG